MEQLNRAEYIEAVKAIKEAIQISRYNAAKLVNKEILSLYYWVGNYVSVNSREGAWNTHAIATISQQLQQELPGLKGFSETGIKDMRIFYEAWCPYLNWQPSVADLKNILPFDQLINRQPAVADLSTTDMEYFVQVGFSLHRQVIRYTSTLEERLFYIRQCATQFWTKDKLIANLKADVFHKEAAPNNFQVAIPDSRLRDKALQVFREDVVLDFLTLPDPDFVDEKEVEQQIVKNIKDFIMALGGDFSFMGNQYRLIVDGEESFIDLLFFNRRLRSLVAVELKSGKFKPEYAGKMNYYLSALDEYVKMPDENPSIGIILCRSMNEKKVEFSFRDMTKPMGVATYHSSSELPEAYKDILPSAEELRKLL